MRARSIVCLLLCLLGCVGAAFPQGCGVNMSKYYDMYTTDSAVFQRHGFFTMVISTSVLTDGYATCQPSASCPCGSAQHTPSAYNRVYNSRTSVGGQLTGSPQCVSCYLSIQNNQTMWASPGEVFSFDATGQVNCTIAGVFFFLNAVVDLEAADTRVISYGPQTNCVKTGTGTNCYYPINNWCSPATTPPDNNLNGTSIKDAWPITFPATWDVIAACYRINYPLFTPWKCSGGIGYIQSQGNPVASKLDCSYNPR